MIIRYKNFEIEQDRSCYIVREIVEIKTGDNKWELRAKDEFYPMNLEKAIESIQHRLLKNKSCTVELNSFLKELKETNQEFLSDIKTLLKEVWKT